MTDASPAGSAEEFWEDFYRSEDRRWSGEANPLLVREAASLTPGTALDLGCGEGADAIWLARRGWRVTATDVSRTALRRAAAHAAEAGVGDRIEWEAHDLSRSFPGGSFDLVSAQFLHSPVAAEGEREAILRRAAAAVAPGGSLLIAGHAGWPSWMDEPPFPHHFPTIPEVLESLDLAPGGWHVDVADVVERELTGPEGQRGHREDHVLRVRRLG
ncbi:class I SAM-dependent methyltransferase [Bailinhaonella thermotolerans]|uniref:Class I SAM-dependent methyltransferase n=1 Tax=Bailinhaonella thermotolerans TaxID=1070861 RepID=A0A3A4B5C0_9ACTN|nr:class I SAM-dependent methyltransferase [Bailinhaonella thermotolerans]RJL32612.1 class I SAM-dependent methyltransferase [Bailinhaonella thermotolerans]